MTYFFIVVAGAISILGQVVLFRELLYLFSGSELFIVLGIGLLLFSSSLGVLSTKGTSMKRTKGLFVIFAFSFVVLFFFCASLRPFFGVVRGLMMTLDKQFASVFLILFPFGFLCGKLFAEASLLALRKGVSVSRTYALDTLGAVGGGIISFLFNHFGFPQSASLIFIVFVAFLAVFISNKIFINILLLLSLIFISPFLYNFSNDFHISLLRFEDKLIKEIKETPYGRISISSDKGQSALFLNNSVIFESESVSSEDLVHIPMLMVENPQEILIVGGTAEGVLKEVLKHKPKKVDVVELDKEMVNFPKKFINDERFDGLKKDFTNLYVSDGRDFIKKCSQYDVVVISSNAQNSISENRFFTEDFFKICYKKIRKGGVLALRVKNSENYQEGLILKRNASIVKPLSEIFEKVMVFPQSTMLIVAVKVDCISVEEAIERFKNRQIETNLISGAYIKYLWNNQRRRKSESQIFCKKWEKNIDLKPIAYILTLILEAARNYPIISSNPSYFEKLRFFSFSLVIFLFLFLLISRFLLKEKKFFILIFTAGFWGMIIETSIIVYHQLKNGVLYKDLGILTSLFMVGLALGASFFPSKISKKVFLFYMLSLTGFSLILFWVVNYEISSFFLFIFIFLGGYFSGSLFKIAEITSKEEGENLLKKLYFIDLLGGAVGAVFSSLILIPFFGLQSCFFCVIFLIFLCL